MTPGSAINRWWRRTPGITTPFPLNSSTRRMSSASCGPDSISSKHLIQSATGAVVSRPVAEDLSVISS